MPAQISPMLAVRDVAGALAFYTAAFGAVEQWRIGGDDPQVACVAIDGAPLFLARESPASGANSTRRPDGFTTVRIELFVDDPVSVHGRAVAAGGVEGGPVVEHSHEMSGPHPIRRMLQGAVVDPAGHLWLIGKVLD
jgi:PhnB protein